MLIRIGDLHRRLLRASPELYVGAALQDLAARPDPATWLLVFEQFASFVVLGLADLARLQAGGRALLDQRLGALGLPPSPAVELDSPLEDARALLVPGGYVLVLRDDAPYGVLFEPPAALAADSLLAQAAGWRPPTRVLNDAEQAKAPTQPARPREPLAPVQQRSDRYVNTDFAAEAAPGQPLDKREPLRVGRWYFFRVHIGEAEASSLETTLVPLPGQVLEDTADIRVVIFSEDFMVSDASGVLRVPLSGPASVVERASTPAGIDANDALLGQRLLFRVQAPDGRRGLFSLRVNMYCRGMLIQSRLVMARVGPGAPLSDTGAQRVSALEFNLSPALAPGHLSAIVPHTLSIMLNSDPAGNQSFRLLGQQGQELFASSATIGEGVITSILSEARRALQSASWGIADGWDGSAAYRYKPGTPPATLAAQFKTDLFDLAAKGARIYAAIKNNLGQGKQGAEQLRELMRAPGVVQMASKVSANDVVPIGLIYDHPLDSQNMQQVCPQFEASLASGRPLAGEPCFVGKCPSYPDERIVCPAGFWGFRHDIGSPAPAPFGPAVALAIGYRERPLIDMAVYSDMALLAAHAQNIDQLPATVQRQSERAAVIEMLRRSEPQLVYFYCHGVLQESNPALLVGSKAAPGVFTTDNWSNLGIEWPRARPLMFINGCHTTALSPAIAFNLVKVLVEEAEAAGVIGTEITIFEELAQPFAERLLALFLGGMPLGRAMREARLGLLAQRNPLGLAYTAHAYAALALVALNE